MTPLRLRLRREGQMKRTKGAALNLVSLMDIFTILVFFLMVNSSEVEVLQTNSKIKLPDSISEQRPENQLRITVTDSDIIVLGRPVAKVAALRNSPGSPATITPLEDELRHQASRKGEIPEGGFEITIMGDHEIPYWLLKKIILTCQATDFARVSLAVNKIASDEPDAGGLAQSSTLPGAAS
jgi:biopolymer transport protein ExbD